MNEQQGPAGEQQPSEEELRAALEEQMKRIRVEDVLLQTTVTLVNLAGRRLGLAAEPGQDAGEDRDLAQAGQAIEAVRALLPLCPEEQTAPIKQALSQLQMVYARETQGAGAPAPGADEQAAKEQPAEPQGGADADAEADRSKARSKIWTPPGS